MSLEQYLHEGALLLKKTADSSIPKLLEKAIAVTAKAMRKGGALLVCGNGGSAADSMHIAGELVGHFAKKRRAYKCMALSADPVLLTALGNDDGFHSIFARQVSAFGEKTSVLIGLSTSGNSKNVVLAFKQAKKMGLTTIAFTGKSGGALKALADILIAVPSTSTPAIQQVHVHLYHYFCENIEKKLS